MAPKIRPKPQLIYPALIENTVTKTADWAFDVHIPVIFLISLVVFIERDFVRDMHTALRKILRKKGEESNRSVFDLRQTKMEWLFFFFYNHVEVFFVEARKNFFSRDNEKWLLKK